MATDKAYHAFIMEQLQEADRQIPYEGAKELLLVDNLEDRAFLKTLFEGIADDLPSKGGKK